MRRIHKNDLVMIISGRERGKIGRVIGLLHQKQRVVIEKAMLVKRHLKPSARNPQQGGIVEQEGSVHISNVMLIDPSTGKPTRVHIVSDGGEVRRIGKSGSAIEVH